MANEEQVNNGSRVSADEMQTRQQVRVLLSTVYDLQKLRISVGNRIVQSFRIQLGLKSSQKSEEMDKENTKLLQSLLKEYKNITDAMASENNSIKKQLKKIQESDNELEYIHKEMDYKLISQYDSLKKEEAEASKVLATYVHEHPMWDRFFKGIIGCGETMAANCIAYIDIDKARHVSSLWKYAGLDVVVETDEEGNITGTHGRRKGDTEMYSYIDKNGNEAEKRGITYQPALKARLMGVLADCIIKAGQRFGENKYEKCYRDYRARLENSAAHKDKKAGHKNLMAKRYMIKQFLRDLWVEWRTYEGYEISQPYEVAFLGNKPHLYNAAHAQKAGYSGEVNITEIA